MLQFLAPLLGGLGGMLFPAAAGAAATGAAATGIGALLSKVAMPAIGAGLGTLAMGGDGKDAIRNALLMGTGAAIFPGIGETVRGSQLGQNITRGLGSIFGMPGMGAPGMGASAVPPMRPDFGSPVPPLASGNTSRVETTFGPSGMELEARPRPVMTTTPTIADIASGSIPTIPELATASSQRAAAEFDQFGAPDMTMRDYEIERRKQDFIRKYDSGQRARSEMVDYLIASGDRRQILRPEMLLPAYTSGYAVGGAVEGPGTGTSDSIPATIFQDGKPVQKAALSDGEFVMTAKAVEGAGNGNRDRGISRMYELMRRFERGEMA